jgi:hypothetical protein
MEILSSMKLLRTRHGPMEILSSTKLLSPQERADQLHKTYKCRKVQIFSQSLNEGIQEQSSMCSLHAHPALKDILGSKFFWTQ